MNGQVPARSAAERKSPYDDPVFVDTIEFLHVFKRLEHVRFAGKARRVAIAMVHMEHEGVPGHELARAPLVLPDKVPFGQILAAPVKPDVEAQRQPGLHRLRHDQSVGLHGTIDA